MDSKAFSTDARRESQLKLQNDKVMFILVGQIKVHLVERCMV